MSKLKIVIALYILGLLAVASLFIYCLYVNPNTFYSITNIAAQLQSNSLIAVAAIGGALFFLAILIVIDWQLSKPKPKIYQPYGANAFKTTNKGYNPKPSQPTTYNPQGITISETANTVIEDTTDTINNVKDTATSIIDKISEVTDIT